MLLAIGKTYKGWNGRCYLCLNSREHGAVLRDTASGHHFTAYGVTMGRDGAICWQSSSIAKLQRVMDLKRKAGAR